MIGYSACCWGVLLSIIVYFICISVFGIYAVGLCLRFVFFALMHGFVFQCHFKNIAIIFQIVICFLLVFHVWCVFLVCLCRFFVRCHDFECVIVLLVFLCLFAWDRSTSPPGGNQVLTVYRRP